MRTNRVCLLSKEATNSRKGSSSSKMNARNWISHIGLSVCSPLNLDQMGTDNGYRRNSLWTAADIQCQRRVSREESCPDLCARRLHARVSGPPHPPSSAQPPKNPRERCCPGCCDRIQRCMGCKHVNQTCSRSLIDTCFSLFRR